MCYGPFLVVAMSTPEVTEKSTGEDTQSCHYLGSLTQLFNQDQTPAQAMCSFLSMCCLRMPGFRAEEKDLFMGSALVSLARLLKEKLTCLFEELASCLSCQKNAREDERMVNMTLKCFW